MKQLIRLLADTERRITALPRRYSALRKAVPFGVVFQVRRVQSYLAGLRRVFVPVRHESRPLNVFHCCVQKTGSQWIRSILSDVLVYRYSGLTPFHYQTRWTGGPDARRLTERRFDRPFPERTLVSPLYVTYENFAAIPKPGEYRAFFVMRDPRDLLVSWYFSTRSNHLLDRDRSRAMYHAREKLHTLPEREGLRFGVDYLRDRGHFAALASWADGAAQDPAVRLVRYEDLAAPNGLSTFRELFDFLDIAIPDDELECLLAAYSFERLTGRKPGTENLKSHLRSGSSGGWRNRFDSELEAYFAEATGDLAEVLGYSEQVG